MLSMMTPIGDAWAAPVAATKSALQRATAHAASTKIPFVDYDGEAADVDHYCRTYGVMCEKANKRRAEPEAFEGLTEDEVNDVFVAAGRPQVEASFTPRAAKVVAAPAPAPAAPAAFAPAFAPSPQLKQPSSDDGWAWLRLALHTDDFYNLALFAIAGLLLVVVLDQMVRIGIEISRARIGMAVALRSASQVTQAL